MAASTIFRDGPFVAVERLWRSGLAGSIVSGVSFVITAIVVYKQSRLIYQSENYGDYFALGSALVFILNPSMLYMQTTPMTEALFICTLASSVYFLQKWSLNHGTKSLLASAVCMALAELTRYEAWSLAPFAGIVVLLLSERRGWRRMIDGGAWGLIVLAVWFYWFWHNWAISGNPLEFYNGYYSAKMIYARQNAHPLTTHSILWTAVEGFGAVLACAGTITAILGLTGLGSFLFRNRRGLRRFAPSFLYIFPLLFHLYSLFTGNIRVQVFLGLENVRYGLPYLVPLALFLPAVASVYSRRLLASFATTMALVLFGYLNIWVDGVHSIKVFQEPYVANYINPEWQARYAVANYIAQHPPAGRTLLDVQAEGIVAPAGLRYRELDYYLNEQWKPDEFATLTTDKQLIVVQDKSNLAAALRDPAVNQSFQNVYNSGQQTSFSVWVRR